MFDGSPPQNSSPNDRTGKWRSVVPADMRAVPRWVAWRYHERDGKQTKVPYNPVSGRCAESDNPSTWGTFEQAITRFRHGGYSGIGFMFGDGWGGVDFDNCIDPDTNKIDPWVMEIVQAFNSYTERSPSGRGLHTFCKGTLPVESGLKRLVNGHNVEVYNSGRFFTVSADHLEGTPKLANDCARQFADFHQWIIQTCKAQSKARKQKREPNDKSNQGTGLSDGELMDRAFNAKNGAKFERLWDGDIVDYPSASEADLAFVSLVCFWTQDGEQVERLWKESGLYREKLERSDYVRRTIEEIRLSQTGRYSADYKPNTNGSQPHNSLKRELIGREQIICRCFAFWGISDESFRTYIAVRGIASRRKTFKLSGALLGRHIRIKDEAKYETKEQAYELDKRFGNRRMAALLEGIKTKINYPLLTIKTKGGKMLPSGKREATRYNIDETPFDEAEALAAEHPATISGSPDYNPGLAREEAALEIARKYEAGFQAVSKPQKPEPDAFQIWIESEKHIWSDAQKISDAWEDLGKTTGERMDFADQMAGHLKEILLQQISKNLRRKRKQKEAFTGS